MSVTQRSCIRLVNAEFYAWHGVLSEEHLLGGKYEVDAELRFDFQPAAEHDNIDMTVDYGRAYEIVRDVMTGRKAALIESLAYRIAMDLLQEFPLLEGVTVKVRKKNVPLGGLCDHAEAEYRIDRS
ncbi:MAG: dihydroneopterin aldolase [Chlorobiaceae bacterium]|nr:dihydroneopterin aldolase [Chlorobiaceae bacterium]